MICTECVERESSTCTRKCRSTRERKIKDTSDCLSPGCVANATEHHTYGDWYGLCTDTCYTFYIVHLPWVGT